MASLLWKIFTKSYYGIHLGSKYLFTHNSQSPDRGFKEDDEVVYTDDQEDSSVKEDSLAMKHNKHHHSTSKRRIFRKHQGRANNNASVRLLSSSTPPEYQEEVVIVDTQVERGNGSCVDVTKPCPLAQDEIALCDQIEAASLVSLKSEDFDGVKDDYVTGHAQDDVDEQTKSKCRDKSNGGSSPVVVDVVFKPSSNTNNSNILENESIVCLDVPQVSSIELFIEDIVCKTSEMALSGTENNKVKEENDDNINVNHITKPVNMPGALSGSDESEIVSTKSSVTDGHVATLHIKEKCTTDNHISLPALESTFSDKYEFSDKAAAIIQMSTLHLTFR
ncbi:hypothetical protein CHUAL_007302 [Chamberlinius hualienensis]